jgi:hypothetical protein
VKHNERTTTEEQTVSTHRAQTLLREKERDVEEINESVHRE